MRKRHAAIVCLILIALVASVSTFVFAAADESPLPQSITIEYSGESTFLPVYPSDGSESFVLEIKNSDGGVVAENVLDYAFDVGEYEIFYTVYESRDVSAVKASYTVSVTVADTTAPAISIRGGGYAQTYKAGDSVTILSAEAADIHDGSVPCSITVSKDGNAVTVSDNAVIAEKGSYTVTYEATDSFGNKAQRVYAFTVEGEENTSGKKKGCGCKSFASARSAMGAAAALITAAAIVLTARRRKSA